MHKISLLIISLALSACSTTGVNSKTGWALIQDIKESAFATGETGTKTGVACSKNYFGVVTDGDSSLAAAMKAGNITKVSTIDHEFQNTIVIGKFCTIVRGN
jgi:hypothetical protein